jgi:hypothetical protein
MTSAGLFGLCHLHGLDGKGEKPDSGWRKANKKDARKLKCVPSYEERKHRCGGEEQKGDLGNEMRTQRRDGRFLYYRNLFIRRTRNVENENSGGR